MTSAGVDRPCGTIRGSEQGAYGVAVSIDRIIRGGLIAAGIVVAGHMSPALAFQFGALRAHSRLNQPLDATVVLADLDASERGSLDVDIAPQALFQRFGIRRSGAVDRIRIDTRMTKGAHRAIVHIATARPVSEPFVDFLLQVDSGNGTAVREYTVMLDPVANATTAPAKPMPSARRVSASGQRRPVHAAGHRAASSDRSRHRVVAGDTLWAIAAANTPSGASVSQAALAIYRANPSAFDGTMDALSDGARLSIPSAAHIRSADAHTARQRLQSVRPSDQSAATKLAMSDEAPHAVSKHGAHADRAAATQPPTNTPKSHGAGDTADATGLFGRLSPPSDTPWPAPQSNADNPPPDTAPGGSQASGATAGPSPRKADMKTATTTAKAPSAMQSSSVSDVSQPADGVWLSPRNLLLFVVLLAAIGLIGRRLCQRGYRSLKLDSTDAGENEVGPQTRDTAQPADASGPSGWRHVTANAASATESPPAPASRAASPMAPTPPAKTMPADTLTEPAVRKPSVAHFEPVKSPASGGLVALHRRTASNEGVEALAFESPTIPDSGERQHDHGGAAKPGLAFDAETMPVADVTAVARHVDEHAADPYALEMIDPGQFDLYDPPAENTDPADDEASNSVAIRLDLGRMYIDMEETEAARELLADVRERGDDNQRRTAGQLLDRIKP